MPATEQQLYWYMCLVLKDRMEDINSVVTTNLALYLLTRIEPMFHISCGLGFSPFLMLLSKHYGLRWSLLTTSRIFKLQFTHCCQVFLGRPHSHLRASSCCVHFFIQPSLRQTWPNQHRRYKPCSLSMVCLNYAYKTWIWYYEQNFCAGLCWFVG